MSNVKSGGAVKPEIVSGTFNFDAAVKSGKAEEIFFDRPIASPKILAEKLELTGWLVSKVRLQKPKDDPNFESEDPDLSTWGAYIVKLAMDAYVTEGKEIVLAKAGREVYLPETAKLGEFDKYLGHHEIFQIAVKYVGLQNLSGGKQMAKYQTALLGTRPRTGASELVGGPQAAQLPQGQSPFAVATPNGAPAMVQGTASIPS